MKYVITVTEKLQKSFVIDSENLEAAEAIVEKAYENGDISLTSEDCQETDISESLYYTREQAEEMEPTDTSGWGWSKA